MSEAVQSSESPSQAEDTPPVVTLCGERLKVARESQGLTLADVAQRLKYAPRQVQALEEGRYEALPGLTFQRGFIRGYAKLVGLDASTLIAQLEREVGRELGPSTMQLQQIAYAPAVLPNAGERTAAWPWILAMLVSVVCIGGYILYSRETPIQQVPPNRPASADNVPPVPSVPPIEAPAGTIGGAPSIPPVGATPSAPSTAPKLPGVEAKPPQSSVNEPSRPPAATTSTSSGRLLMVFSGESWVEVRQANGSVVYSGTNVAGSEQKVDGEPPFDLVIGNARAVKLTYRDVPVNLEPYTKVTVARLQLK